jgi:putative phosphoesterase
MLIGIVSDTHGHVGNTLQAVTQLEQYDLAAVLHCGDIVGAGLVPLFAAWPTHFVFGNCDADKASMRLAMADAGQTCHGAFGEIEIDDRRIAILHGDDSRRLQEAVQSGQYDLVCHGHTHIPEQHQVGQTVVLNPGALYRANPHTFAIVDLRTMQVTHIPLDSHD